jgi:hypothetical protein
MEGFFLPSICDTAYPRFRSTISNEELYKLYTPTSEEIDFANKHTKRDFPKLGGQPIAIKLRLFKIKKT